MFDFSYLYTLGYKSNIIPWHKTNSSGSFFSFYMKYMAMFLILFINKIFVEMVIFFQCFKFIRQLKYFIKHLNVHQVKACLI